MVLGKRGMELVHMVDADDDIGGCMRWITRMPGLGGWGHVIDYRRVQLDRLDNVSLGMSVAADAPSRCASTARRSWWSRPGRTGRGDGLSAASPGGRSPAPTRRSPTC